MMFSTSDDLIRHLKRFYTASNRQRLRRPLYQLEYLLNALEFYLQAIRDFRIINTKIL